MPASAKHAGMNGPAVLKGAFEFISHTIDGADVVLAAGLNQFLAEIFDMGVDEIIVIGQIHIVAPEMFCYGIFGDNPVFIADEI